MAVATKTQEVTNLGDSLLSTWTNSLDRVCAVQKEAEDLLLQTLESQKETWEKVTSDLTRIEEEQKKLTDELRESVKLNIQKVFGAQASKAFEQFNAQFDDVSTRVQQLTATPYKESLNLVNQTQDQFQQSLKSGIDQQQKFREDVTSQLKASQKVLIDLYQTNSKLTLGLFK
jgi:hypothetical protein